MDFALPSSSEVFVCVGRFTLDSPSSRSVYIAPTSAPSRSLVTFSLPSSFIPQIALLFLFVSHFMPLFPLSLILAFFPRLWFIWLSLSLSSSVSHPGNLPSALVLFNSISPFAPLSPRLGDLLRPRRVRSASFSRSLIRLPVSCIPAQTPDLLPLSTVATG